MNKAEIQPQTKSPNSTKKASAFLEYLWMKRKWLTAIYVFVCAFRSFLPRHDGERSCLWDTPNSSVLIGRSAATIAEICYAALISLWVVRITKQEWHFYFWVFVNCIAQSCCWYSVLTQNQIGHIIEESIWTFTAFTMMLSCLKFSYSPSYNALPPNSSLRKFIKYFILISIIYLVFMVVVDVPMYIDRYRIDENAGKIYQTISEGFEDISKCRVLQQNDSFWVPEMPWMTGYFSFGVWSSIILG